MHPYSIYFDPEDRSSMFFRNAGLNVQDYTVVYAALIVHEVRQPFQPIRLDRQYVSTTETAAGLLVNSQLGLIFEVLHDEAGYHT
jgi:hypothetical protein